ncbi:cell wall metabolism sensor histidine kinase WalK [Aurantimicrobium sp. MWH-Uga1]|uniref:sensor histidine kinase n=1 Tax=Aurantimicrobium sp. MWH-Uga1 TaxID=2079575 RepID=UPI000DED9BAA|nr:HAMP domain-containing sensor histidine kinase [Aurantimicrobium sp. MWH-Uga1]AXE54009.1 putative sensor histidine kinase TcrY [Aurantimicrobium sp. MWH-Uga1]
MPFNLTDTWNAISLRTKVTGVTVLLLTIGLLVSGIGTMAMLKPALIGQLDTQLKAVEQDLSSVLQLSKTGTTQQTAPTDYYYAVYSASGILLEQNWSDKPAASRPDLPNGITVAQAGTLDGAIFPIKSENNRTLFHAIAVPVTFDDSTGTLGTVVVALSTASVDRLMTTYLSIFLGLGIAIVIVGALLTRFLVTTTFAPLRQVEETAVAIADGNLSLRLPASAPTNTEVGRLNRSLNIMLARIDRAFADRARTIDQMQRFVGDASHELRTPLVSVRGYAELYRMGALQTPEDVAQAMDRIEKEAIRMGALVEDLLELARMDESRPLEISTFDLLAVAQDAALDAGAFDPERTITVSGDSVEIQAEENKIRQVVTNLMGNALRFTPVGSPLELVVSHNDGAKNATISIVDHGEGIPKQLREKIFERFYRADNSRARETGGSGLGLAIVASIVKAHGGDIKVTATKGGGATFSVSLPVVHTPTEL